MDDRQDFVDVEMFDRFSASHRKHLAIYDHMIGAIFKAYAITSNDNETDQFIEVVEVEIDKYVDMLLHDDLDPFDEEESMMVYTFLNTLQSVTGWKRLLYKGVEVLNAHDFVAKVTYDAAFTWIRFRKECRNTSESATNIFFKEVIWEQDLPLPIELYALLAAEYAKAREILLAQPEMPQ